MKKNSGLMKKSKTNENGYTTYQNIWNAAKQSQEVSLN